MNRLTFRTLIAFDWKQLSRSSVFWLLTGLLVVTGLYAALYGRSEVAEQQQKIRVLQHDIDSSMQQVRLRLQRQDTIAAWQYDDFLFALHANPPDGVAALAFGQRDLHKFAVSITIGTYFYNRYAGGYENKTLSGELANPLKQFAGHLDLSFVLVFLLPLYLILISYNILSSEQEGGTLALLAVQSVRISSLVYTKLALRAGLTIAVGWLISVAGAGLTGALGDGRLWYFLASVLLYVACWAGVIALVTAFRWPSGVNALALISSWLFLSIILPATFTAILNVTHPTGTKAALIASVQQANARVFGTSHPTLATEFYRAYPQYNSMPGDTFPGMWYNARWMRAVHLLLDRDVKPFEDRYQQQLRARIEAADGLDYYSPALLTQSILNRVAGSDMAQMAAYNQSIYAHFAQWRDYLDQRTYLHRNVLTKEEFDQLPRDGFKLVVDYQQIIFRLTALLLTAILLFLIAATMFNRVINQIN